MKQKRLIDLATPKTLSDWKKEIDLLITQYGEEAKLYPDAGYYNSWMILEVEEDV